jgi:aminomethyltransferase
LRDEPEKVKVGLFTDSKVPVREGCVIFSNEDIAIGYVTSGSFSPSLQRPIAIALVDPYALDLGYPLHTMVREHRIEVTLTSLPFIPHRYQR